MIVIKYCRAPSHNWVGWAYYDNGLYYSAGTTLDNMVARFKANIYSQKRVSATQVILDTKPTEIIDMPMDKIKQMFLTKYYFAKDGEPKKAPSPAELGVSQQTPYAYYDKEIVDGMLYVYGVQRTLVATYNLEPTMKANI